MRARACLWPTCARVPWSRDCCVLARTHAALVVDVGAREDIGVDFIKERYYFEAYFVSSLLSRII